MNAIELIAAERRRQIAGEGWSFAHDDGHANRSLGRAAACYAAAGGMIGDGPLRIYQRFESGRTVKFEELWPWENGDTRKKHPYKRRLVIAGALIVAELERLARLEKRET